MKITMDNNKLNREIKLDKFFQMSINEYNKFLLKEKNHFSQKIYLTSFEPERINKAILIGCETKLNHHNYCIDVILDETNLFYDNDWSYLMQSCFFRSIAEGKNKLNKVIYFAPYSEFTLTKYNTQIINGKTFHKYQFLLSKNNRLMINEFESCLKRDLCFFFFNHHHNRNIDNLNLKNFLIEINSTESIIDLYFLIIFFIYNLDYIKKEVISTIQKIILSKIEAFFEDSRFHFLINVLFFQNFIENLGLQREIAKLDVKEESLYIIKLVKEKIKDLDVNDKDNSRYLVKFLLELFKKMDKILEENEYLRKVQIDFLKIEITEILTKLSEEIKKCAIFNEISKIENVSLILNKLINYLNNFEESFNSKLTKLYLITKSSFTSNRDSTIVILRNIEELTTFTFENYIQILNLKKNIYLYFYELLLINIRKRFKENSFILALLIILYIKTIMNEMNVDEEEKLINMEKIYSFSYKYVILLIEISPKEFIEIIINRIKIYGGLNIFKSGVEEIIILGKNKDYAEFQKPLKKFKFLQNENKHLNISHDKNSFEIETISSNSFVENSVLVTEELVWCNDPSAEDIVTMYGNKTIIQLLDYPQLCSFNKEIINFLTRGLSKDKLLALKALINTKNKSQDEKIAYRKILLEIKSSFPNEEMFLKYFQRTK